MRKIISYFSLILLVSVLGTSLAAETQAATKVASKKASVKTKKYALDLYNPRKVYGDEKKDIKDATSRCNTPALHKIHLQNLERAKLDGKPHNLTFESVSTTEPLSDIQEAYKKYLESLSFAWGAMEEPYCGFGAFGVSAARKSYDKSVERARARFLEAVKKLKVATPKKTPIVAASGD